MSANPYASEFAAASAQYKVPQLLLEAIAWTESSMGRFDGPGDGVGIMQVLPSTGAALGFSLADLNDPAKNIMAGAAAAADIIRRQGGIQLADFYSEYNSGRKLLWRTSTQVKEHVENFLGHVARLSGLPPMTGTIEDALARLASIPAEGMTSFLIVVALILMFKKK